MLRRVFVLGVAATTAIAVAAGCSSAPAATPIIVYVTPPPVATPTAAPLQRLIGHLTVEEGSSALTLHNLDPNSESCLNMASISAGEEVLLLNDAKTTIGKGVLVYSTPKYFAGRCQLDFVISAVPPASFYLVRIGLHNGPTWSAEDLKTSGWHVSLSL